MPYKFRVFKDNKNEYRFSFVAPNGEIMFASEGYTQKSSLMKSIKSIQKNVAKAHITEEKST